MVSWSNLGWKGPLVQPLKPGPTLLLGWKDLLSNPLLKPGPTSELGQIAQDCV